MRYTRHNWIIGKETDPTQRPRIDWLRTWAQFIPFWICFSIIVGITVAGLVATGLAHG